MHGKERAMDQLWPGTGQSSDEPIVAEWTSSRFCDVIVESRTDLDTTHYGTLWNTGGAKNKPFSSHLLLSGDPVTFTFA